MTDPGTDIHHPAPLSSQDDSAVVFGGVFPTAEGAGGSDSAFRHGSSDSSPRSDVPHLVGLFHGILTRQSSRTWPVFGAGYLEQLFPQVETIASTYFALPLPRIEALRNRERARVLIREFLVALGCLRNFQESPLCADDCKEVAAAVSIVSHSNGGVLALQVARGLIAKGVPIRVLVLIAPALRTGPASEEIMGWLESGVLDRAVLVRPTRDLLIASIGANWRTKLFSWPWGSLGSDGWSADALQSPAADAGLLTLDLPDMGHSDPVSHTHRAWLFESVICPALGLSAWGPLQPKGGLEA